MTNGIAALRRAWPRTTWRRTEALGPGGPDVVATSASSRLERRILVRPAAEPRPTTIAGRIRWAGSPAPDTGRIRRLTAKTRIRTWPSTKPGIAWPRTAIDRAVTSTHEPGRSAAAMPSGTEIRSDTATPARPRARVAGTRARTIPRAGSRVFVDVPKSPWIARPRKPRNWIGKGWSKPRLCRSESTADWGASSGSRARTGSLARKTRP